MVNARPPRRGTWTRTPVPMGGFEAGPRLNGLFAIAKTPLIHGLVGIRKMVHVIVLVLLAWITSHDGSEASWLAANTRTTTVIFATNDKPAHPWSASLSKLKITPRTGQERPRKKLPGQGVTLGDKFKDALGQVTPSDGNHMQTEDFWQEVWRK